VKQSYKLAICVACVCALWLLSGYVVPSKPSDTDNVVGHKAYPSVQCRLFEAQSRHNVLESYGQSSGYRHVPIRAQTVGTVVDVYKDKGDYIKGGQPIFKLDQRDRDEKITKARAAIKQYEAEFNAARRLKNKGFQSSTSLAAIEAGLADAKASLKEALLDKEHQVIVAPFSGILEDLTPEKGSFVTAGEVVGKIIELDPMLVTTHISERKKEQTYKGQKATVVTVGGQKLDGVVTYVSPTAHARTRTFALEIEVKNPNKVLKAGMTCEALLQLTPIKAHYVPTSLLSLSDDGVVGVKAVMPLTSDQKDQLPDDVVASDMGQVVFMPIDIVSTQKGEFCVKNLPDKVRLVTVGQAFVSDGMVVKVNSDKLGR
jgi:multidrug efflux system membrane fusion protein